MRASRRRDNLIKVQRQISAIRAFHTGLIAETHRHLRALQQMTPHIELLRSTYPTASAKLEAVRAACRELRRLEALKEPWRETYRDFRRSLRRTRTLFVRLVRRSVSEPTDARPQHGAVAEPDRAGARLSSLSVRKR